MLIEDGHVRATGPALAVPEGATVIDARGKEVLPGFIDAHAHDDAALLRPGGVEPKLRQGITTSVIGNCGHGCAPSGPGDLEEYSTPVLGPFPQRRWATFADYLGELETVPLRLNALALVPHAPLRIAAMGIERRPASAAERDRIAGLAGEAMAAGAAGVSLGLMYAPGNAADHDELVALARAAARHDGLLVAHIRNEADHLLPSLAELAEVARRAGAAAHVSHLKITGPRNAGRMPEAIAYLDGLRTEGLDITADVYPYEAGSTTVAALFPDWATDRGVSSLLEAVETPATRRRLLEELPVPWDGSAQENQYASLGPQAIVLAGFGDPGLAEHEGRSLADIAARRGQDPLDCLLDLVTVERARLSVVLFQADPAGIEEALAWPWTLLGTDGLPHPQGYVHPRLYGTFPRLLERFTGPGGPLTRAELAKRASRDTAARFGLPEREGIVPGAVADLQVLDPARYADQATFADPRRSPAGLDEVLVRGAPALSTAAQAGRWEPAQRSA